MKVDEKSSHSNSLESEYTLNGLLFRCDFSNLEQTVWFKKLSPNHSTFLNGVAIN